MLKRRPIGQRCRTDDECDKPSVFYYSPILSFRAIFWRRAPASEADDGFRTAPSTTTSTSDDPFPQAGSEGEGKEEEGDARYAPYLPRTSVQALGGVVAPPQLLPPSFTVRIGSLNICLCSSPPPKGGVGVTERE